jgi:hypothetical protein
LLTLKETAEILRMNPKMLRGYVLRREIDGRIIRGEWRFSSIGLDRFYETTSRNWDFLAKRKEEN